MAAPSMEQLQTLVLIIRTMAALSTISVIVLLLTFLLFKEFRTLPNTLLFLATPTNLLANTGAFIGAGGFKIPSGAACQVQGFMFEW